MVKCACGCGQDIPEGASKVGVPTGEGDFVAFIPEHHRGPQMALAGGGEVDVGQACADNPLNKREVQKIRKRVNFFKRERGDSPRQESLKEGIRYGLNSIIADYGPKKKGHRRNVAQVVAAEKAIGLAKKAGPAGGLIGIAHMGKNPGRPTAEFWRKTYFPIYWYYRKDRGFSEKRARKAASGTTASIWHYRISPQKKAQYEAMRRLREGRGRIGINSAGTINVDGSRITEVRYVEHGTGQKWRHRLVRPVRMRVRGGKVHIPPMKVRPEGITQ